MQDLLNTLTPAQRHAIDILKTVMDCYNTRDGIGLFSGLSRYHYLQTRCEIAAVQSRDLIGFWSALRRKLQLPIPPKKADAVISKLWQHEHPPEVLRCLATESAECVMIARMLHDGDKSERKKLWQETLEAEQAFATQTDEFNDSLEEI